MYATQSYPTAVAMPHALAAFYATIYATVAAGPVVHVAVGGTKAVHTVDDLFVSFTMDTGDIAGGYATMDMEAPDVRALVRAVGPAYVRLSGGLADSLGYNATTVPASSPSQPTVAAGAPPHCVPYNGDSDCGNCDAANSPQGPPAMAMPSPTRWFNRSTWDRVNAFAAAVDFQIIYGLNSCARVASNTPWDGRFGMAELINHTAAQDPLKYPVAGFGACSGCTSCAFSSRARHCVLVHLIIVSLSIWIHRCYRAGQRAGSLLPKQQHHPPRPHGSRLRRATQPARRFRAGTEAVCAATLRAARS